MSSQKYAWTPGMDEISGFGGSYEQACRKMLIAGLEWFEKHPKAKPQYQGFKGVMGLLKENNEAAKELDKAILASVHGDASGAMHQAVITHIFFIRKNGWPKYCQEMSKRTRFKRVKRIFREIKENLSLLMPKRAVKYSIVPSPQSGEIRNHSRIDEQEH